MIEFEEKLWAQDRLVLGIDEAGRGPMAGPCIVCGVIFPKNYKNSLIDDSKKLSDKKRRSIVEQIKADALRIELLEVSVEEIDEKNIYQATKDAMTTIANLMNVDYVITDAMPLDIQDKEVHALIKADQKSVTVAAASILAKTHRDDLMIKYDAMYPEYGFAKHKGYGTKIHKEAILKYGRCPVHRKTFRFKDEHQVSLDI